ncbi:MAG: LysM peptidoglycan-binding domain-containing protein [Lachnospiraceae bacterium]|nr:LysM peptidoglycan-binding domain-containing protein [Lachnospiraceae bacterium]
MESERRIRFNRIRRKRQLRNRVIIAALILTVSIISGIIGCSFMSRAQDEHADISYKYYTSVMVEPGDTLYSIAAAYTGDHYDSVYECLEEIRVMNNIHNIDKIRSGDYLIIPYFSKDFK